MRMEDIQIHNREKKKMPTHPKDNFLRDQNNKKIYIF